MVLPYSFLKNSIKLIIDPNTDSLQVSALKITCALLLGGLCGSAMSSPHNPVQGGCSLFSSLRLDLGRLWVNNYYDCLSYIIIKKSSFVKIGESYPKYDIYLFKMETHANMFVCTFQVYVPYF